MEPLKVSSSSVPVHIQIVGFEPETSKNEKLIILLSSKSYNVDLDAVGNTQVKQTFLAASEVSTPALALS